MQNKPEHPKDQAIERAECFKTENWPKLRLKAKAEIAGGGGDHPQIPECLEGAWLSTEARGAKIWKGGEVKRGSKEE